MAEGKYADASVVTAAQFVFPGGVAVDAAGTVYVADWGNNRVRKITPDGTVSTLAGSGVRDYADGLGASALFYHPNGVAVDATGAVYVADSFNSRIRKIAPAAALWLPSAPAEPQATALVSARLRFRCGAGYSLRNAALCDGQVGPITKRLQRAYMDIVRGVDKRFPEWRTPTYRAVRV